MKYQKSKKVVQYDPRGDVFYIGKRGMEEEFIEVIPGVNVELDEKGQVIGIEILNASHILKPLSAKFGGRSLAPAR